jgi:eukaryotic-like serine/threonine-protein kinase
MIGFGMQPNERVERYELLGELATGGMATVYLGRQTGPFGFKRTVAIKSMHPHIAKDEDFRAMFLDEATLTARIRHPNVVPTLDIVVAETKVLLVMEYIDGVSLSFLERLLKKDNGESAMFPPAVAVAIVLDVLHGLHAAHELIDDADGKPLNVVHRDVSPQNIHVGVDGLTRVLDFGIAKATTRRYVTQAAGEVKGKLSYMASEQVSGGEVDRRTDIFAAGVVLWELLCGRRLFDGQNDADVIRLVMEGKAEPPSFLTDEEIPPALDKVVMKAIALKKEDRYGASDEMARALAAALSPASRADVTAFVRKHAASELDARSRRFREQTVVTADVDVAAEPEAKAVLTVLMEHATFTALSTSRHASGAASIPPPSSLAPVGESSSSKTLTRLLLAGATLVVILALTGGAFLVGSRSAATRNANANANPNPSLPGEAASTFPGIATATAAATSSTPPPTSVAASSSETTPSAAATSTTPKKTTAIPPKKPPVIPPTTTTKPAGAAKKDCNPPFTVDAHGDRHYKPECVE